MIDKYDKHIVPFMMRSYWNNVVGDIVDAENDALEYILKESDFIEKDIVAAQVLVQELCDRKLLEMIGNWNSPRQFKITRIGIDSINR
jgi:hypothetical protein